MMRIKKLGAIIVSAIVAFSCIASVSSAAVRSGSDFDVAELVVPPTIPPKHEPDISPQNVTKQIDYLGDNDGKKDKDNPDTTLDDNGTLGLHDMYRLYLNLRGDSEAYDLVLVLDESTSMLESLQPGVSREQALMDFLNGSKGNDGFMDTFLKSNPNNRIAIVGFNETARPIQHWTRTPAQFKLNTGDPYDQLYTNYMSALRVAGELFEEAGDSNSANTKMMIFLSDGKPTLGYMDGVLRNTIQTSNTIYSNSKASLASVTNLLLINMDAYGYVHYAHGGKWHQDETVNSAPNTPLESIYVTLGPNALSAGQTPSVGRLVKDLAYQIPGCDSDLRITDRARFDSFFAKWNTAFRNRNKDPEAWEDLNDMLEDICSIDPREATKVDMFDLSKVGFLNFREINPKVVVNTVGYSSELNQNYTDMDGNKKYAKETLEFMAMYGAGTYSYCPDGATLAEGINNLCFLTNVSLSDTLSEYVKVADDPEIKVVCKDTDSGKETVLYSGNSITKEGETIIENVSLDPKTGKFDVKFKPEYAIRKELIYTASFNVKTSDAAYEEYKERGDYSERGDSGTDYGTNKTSSNKDGFYSNTTALLEWKIAGKDHEEEYDKPVIQITVPVLYKLPSAGSPGEALLMILGSMLLTLSFAGMIKRRQKLVKGIRKV